jgi:hypothetical protein
MSYVYFDSSFDRKPILYGNQETNHCLLPERVEKFSVVAILVTFLNQPSKPLLRLDGIVHALFLELVLQLSCKTNVVPKRPKRRKSTKW